MIEPCEVERNSTRRRTNQLDQVADSAQIGYLTWRAVEDQTEKCRLYHFKPPSKVSVVTVVRAWEFQPTKSKSVCGAELHWIGDPDAIVKGSSDEETRHEDLETT